MGAWIETESERRNTPLREVAPRVGAWIETESERRNTPLRESHPVWVRGLKLSEAEEAGFVRPVAPRVGAWIET